MTLKDEGATPMDKAFKLDQKKGCCPGQRAHHVVPQTKFDRKRTKEELERLRKDYGDDYNEETTCSKYTKSVHNNAPTICVEGGHSSGTHGKMHGETDEATRDTVNNATEHNLENTLEASAKAFEKTFPHCKKECIKEQLDNYYKGKGLEECLEARGARGKTEKPIPTPTPKPNDTTTNEEG